MGATCAITIARASAGAARNPSTATSVAQVRPADATVERAGIPRNAANDSVRAIRRRRNAKNAAYVVSVIYRQHVANKSRNDDGVMKQPRAALRIHPRELGCRKRDGGRGARRRPRCRFAAERDGGQGRRYHAGTGERHEGVRRRHRGDNSSRSGGKPTGVCVQSRAIARCA